LDKWLAAIWLIANAKNGISSYEIHRSIGVTQKTAWFMLHRIRIAMQSGSFEKMKGEVEIDETFIGGKARNMHFDRNQRRGRGMTGGVGKAIVVGLLERGDKGSKVKALHVSNRRRPVVETAVRANVEKGAEVFTDALPSYNKLAPDFLHQFIDHAETYVNGRVHTNGLENFWSLLKRTIKGTYVSVEPFHLVRYLDEQAFRFNERKDSDRGRFLKAVHGVIGKGLTYLELMDGKGGEDLPPASAGAWEAV
jgi:transposase-like protein